MIIRGEVSSGWSLVVRNLLDDDDDGYCFVGRRLSPFWWEFLSVSRRLSIRYLGYFSIINARSAAHGELLSRWGEGGGKMKKRILAVRTFDTPQSSNPTTSISNQRFTRAPSNRVPFSPSDVESRVRWQGNEDASWRLVKDDESCWHSRRDWNPPRKIVFESYRDGHDYCNSLRYLPRRGHKPLSRTARDHKRGRKSRDEPGWACFGHVKSVRPET